MKKLEKACLLLSKMFVLPASVCMFNAIFASQKNTVSVDLPAHVGVIIPGCTLPMSQGAGVPLSV